MAGTISFDGLATGINATETVDKLMEVESRPKIIKEAEKTRYENQRSAWREVNTKLLALRDVTKTMWRSSTWSSINFTSSNSSVLTATAGYGAKEGIYNLSVEKLALNGQQVSKAFAAKTDLVGVGTLDVTVGGSTVSVTTTDTDTLSTLADKINATGLSITASVVKSGVEYKLLVSANKTGIENDVTLGGDMATTLALASIQDAQDAEVKLGSGAAAMSFTSSTNSMTELIDGVTLNLNSAAPGETITLTTSRDTTSVEENLQKFVDAYNDVVGYIGQLTDFDSANNIRGVLMGDTMVNNAADRIRQLVTNTVIQDGVFKTLRSIGLTSEDDGTLTLDTEKLETALTTDYSAVEDVFRKTSVGLAPRLDEYLQHITSPILGLTDSKIAALDTAIQNTQSRIDDMDERLKAKREMLMIKFTKMESLVKSFSTQSDFLTSQLSGLNKNWGTN